jgi:hypothetical protein
MNYSLLFYSRIYDQMLANQPPLIRLPLIAELINYFIRSVFGMALSKMKPRMVVTLYAASSRLRVIHQKAHVLSISCSKRAVLLFRNVARTGLSEPERVVQSLLMLELDVQTSIIA